MNLIHDRWLPVTRARGYERIAPHEIADAANPVLCLAATRPDFQASLMQFLIGLVQTACPPTGQQDWIARYIEPPTPDQLGAALESLVPYFSLDGDGIRFMQDYAQKELAEQEPKSISNLLIDGPGEKTVEDNRDLFVKRRPVTRMCEACAATALFSLQTNAPGGGTGQRASLRGMGAFTTVVVASPLKGRSGSLWQSVWLNVMEKSEIARNHPAAEETSASAPFPWAVRTRTSEDRNSEYRDAARRAGGEIPDIQAPQITYADGHPLWVYWAAPRRIALDFDTIDVGTCDLCGESVSKCVRFFRTRILGANYTTGWRHPLSPYYRKKVTDPVLLPLHPKNAVSYRDWLGLVCGAKQLREPALVVSKFFERREALARHLRDPQRLPFRLHAFGYQIENSSKAVLWHESKMPLPSVDSGRIEDVVREWVEGAEAVSEFLRNALRDAWLSDKDKRRKSFFTFTLAISLRDSLWQATESTFYRLLDDLSAASVAAFVSDELRLALRQTWHQSLCRAAVHLFEQHAESGPAEQGNAKRVALARHQLVLNLGGRKLKEALGIPVEALAAAGKKSRSRAKGAGDAAAPTAPAIT